MELISLNENKIKYFNEEYGITIIEIDEEDNLDFDDFLELDDNILANISKNNELID